MENGNANYPNTNEFEVDLDALLDINEQDLSTEYSRQASRYASFATRLAMLDHNVSRARAALEQERAVADTFWRDDMKNKGVKYTETVIASIVAVDDTVMKAEANYHSAVQQRDYVRAIVRALEMRAEMLISLGATLRQEASMTGMRINEVDDTLNRVKENVLQARAR